MSRYLWVSHLVIASLVGWGGLTWLVLQTSPQTALARLGVILALAVGFYATACMLAYAACLLLWPTAPRFAIRTFSKRQGLLWSGFLTTIVLLRLSDELSAFTVLVALVFFGGAQYLQLRQSA